MVTMVRIKCTDKLGNVAYIHRFIDGAVTCMLANSIPAALSYAGVLGDEVAFKAQISDIEDGQAIVDLLNLCKPLGQTYEWVNKPKSPSGEGLGGVHCPAHVDYDPSSRIPAPTGHAADVAAAKQKLLEVLADLEPQWVAKVHYWEPPGQGLRINELCWVSPPGQRQHCLSVTDEERPAAIYYAERYLMSILFDDDDQEEEARRKLVAALQ